MSGLPARRYSWPPFEKDHTRSMTHGAYSPRVRDPVSEDLIQVAVNVAPYLGDPSYRPAVEAWARAEATALLLAAFIDKHGPLDHDGNPRPALEALRQYETLALNHRSRLGLDPLSRARLGRDVTAQRVNLAHLMTQEDDE